MTDIVFEFSEPLRLAVVTSRPSKVVKSPYVADIMFADDPVVYQAHAPSLGCSGLVDVESNVYVSGKPTTVLKPGKVPPKTTFTIYGTTIYGGWRVGVNPMIANKVVRRIIECGLTSSADFPAGSTIEQEVTVGDSRIDMKVTHADGSISWVEVKNVPLAHYRNMPAGCKDYRVGAMPAMVGDDPRSKIAIFPDGYRKNKTDAISPRATKHLENLMERVAAGDHAYCIYLCQRTDATRFEPATLDTIYSDTFKRAVAAGVGARCYVVDWSRDFKSLRFLREIPVVQSSNHS